MSMVVPSHLPAGRLDTGRYQWIPTGYDNRAGNPVDRQGCDPTTYPQPDSNLAVDTSVEGLGMTRPIPCTTVCMFWGKPVH